MTAADEPYNPYYIIFYKYKAIAYKGTKKGARARKKRGRKKRAKLRYGTHATKEFGTRVWSAT